MTSTVTLPYLRAEVIAAVRALSDREYQLEQWGRYDDERKYYDDLDINIHTLYDDCQVLPEPEKSVGTILYADEVPAIYKLGQSLDTLLTELGDRPDDDYLSDSRWTDVIRFARSALDVMQRHEKKSQHRRHDA